MQKRKVISVRYRIIPLALMVAALLCSCADTLPEKGIISGGGYEKFEDSESGGKGGALTVTARVSNGASRHAMPSIPELVYAALLYKDDESPEDPESKDFAQGTAVESGKLIFSFQRPGNTSETFTLEIFAFVKTEGGETPQFSKETALLSGYKEGLAIVGDAIVVTDPIALSSDKQGTVNLKIKVPDGCTLEFKELKIDGTTESDLHFAITGTSPNFVLAQKDENGISAGAYPVTFTVEKVNGEKKEIIHIFSEYINVINGLCTNTWSGLAKGAAKEITQSMISSTVYVRGTGEGGGWYANSDYKDTAIASDTNSGSFLSPLATIQKAVDTIIARNDGTSVYTIFVDGTFTATSSAALANFNALSQTQKLSVKIVGLDASKKAVLDGGGLASGIVVGKPAIYASAEQKNMNLTLENLVIQNAISTNVGYGGAIMLCCKADNSLTIKKCEIKKNNAAYGSAIYNEYAALDLQECLISENTTTNNGTVYITRAGAILTTSRDVRIENNTSRYYAGGVYVGEDSEFRMNGGAIIGNKATFSPECGGGVYVAEGGAFTMNGGTISGNTAKNGGGVYINAGSSGMGTFNMRGEASIPAGDDGKNDVYLKASGSNTPIITVAGDLTAATTPVATITLSAYTAGRQVLTKGTDASAPAITQDVCDKFALSEEGWEIVPDGANGVLKTTTVYAASTGSDSNSGDRLHPFATIQKAVGTVLAMNDGTDDYTIFVDGTLDGTTAALLGTNGMADFSALDKKLTLTIKSLSESAKATFDGGGRFNVAEDGTFTVTADGIKKSIIYANPTSGTLNLTLENLVITGGNTSSSGGGIYFDPANGTLTMNKCEISGNTADYKGGGVYAGDSATVTLTNCAIESCKTTSTTSGNGGGGIYSLGTLIVTGGTISDCIAGRSGGGIYAYGGTVKCSDGVAFSNCEATGSGSVGSGGGICINSGVTVNVSGCTFVLCKAGASGGGIWNAGELIVSNTSFTTCSASNKGGGICNSGGTVDPINVTYSSCTASSDNDTSGF